MYQFIIPLFSQLHNVHSDDVHVSYSKCTCSIINANKLVLFLLDWICQQSEVLKLWEVSCGGSWTGAQVKYFKVLGSSHFAINCM